MERCKYCGGNQIRLEALNALIVDFDTPKNNSAINFTISIGNTKMNNNIIQGNVEKSCYCPKCKKIFMELVECS